MRNSFKMKKKKTEEELNNKNDTQKRQEMIQIFWSPNKQIPPFIAFLNFHENIHFSILLFANFAPILFIG